MSKSSIDSKLIRELAEILNDTGLTEIEVEAGEDLRIRVAREPAPTMVQASVPAPMAAPAAGPIAAPPVNTSAPAAGEDADYSNHPGAVKSPMVGVVYVAPEPGAAPFVAVGDMVAEGQSLFLIEAMKTFNPVRAQKGGKVTQILVADGTPVEYGEPLLIIE